MPKKQIWSEISNTFWTTDINHFKRLLFLQMKWGGFAWSYFNNWTGWSHHIFSPECAYNGVMFSRIENVLEKITDRGTFIQVVFLLIFGWFQPDASSQLGSLITQRILGRHRRDVRSRGHRRTRSRDWKIGEKGSNFWKKRYIKHHFRDHSVSAICYREKGRWKLHWQMLSECEQRGLPLSALDKIRLRSVGHSAARERIRSILLLSSVGAARV